MKNFVLVFAVLFILLTICSCTDYYEILEKDKTDTENVEITGETEYVVNTASYSYHLASCYIANNIKDENKVVTKDIDFITEREYTPCKKCIDK